MYAVVILLAGAGRYRDQNGVDLRLSAGDLIVVFPELGHQYGPEAGDTWDEIFISFEGAAFDAWRAEGWDSAHPVWSVGNPHAWRGRLTRLLRSRLETRADVCEALGVLHRLLAEWLALRPAAAHAVPWLDAARHALAAPSGGPEMDVVARAAGFSPDGFRRAFRMAAGETPAAFRRRQRLAQASRLLRRPDLTLDQIASVLGFCDAFHLSKAFKKEYKVSPRAYREVNGPQAAAAECGATARG